MSRCEVSGRCLNCLTAFSLFAQFDERCRACHQVLFAHPPENPEFFQQCPLCACAHLYQQKDFNRAVGLVILLVGIGLAYWTYGLSLLIVTALDFLIYRLVGSVGICYLCETQYRAETVHTLPQFNLVLFDHYRLVRQHQADRALSKDPPTQH